MTSVPRNTESANAHIALLASVGRMRYRKGAKHSSSTMIGVDASRHLAFREQRNKTPYRRKEHASSRPKRANPVARQKDDRTAAFPASRSTSPSNSSSSAPSSPLQETTPYFSIFQEPTDVCMLTRSHTLWPDIGEREIDAYESSEKSNAEEEIVREMFIKYTNFDTWKA